MIGLSYLAKFLPLPFVAEGLTHIFCFSPCNARSPYFYLSPLWERSLRCFYAAGEGVKRNRLPSLFNPPPSSVLRTSSPT